MEYYNGGFPKFYDLVQYGVAEKEATEEEMLFVNKIFNTKATRKVERILDAGCGTGRFLVPLKRKGYNIHGLDLSSEMIEECRRRLAKFNATTDFFCMSIEDINFKSEYDASVCIDSVICYLLEPGQMINALKNVYEALRPGGVLILETWNVFNQLNLVNCERKFHREDQNKKAIVFENDEFNLDTKILKNHIELTGFEDGKEYRVMFKDHMRLVSYDEMCSYIEAAGFSAIDCYSGFDFSPPSRNHSDSFVYVGVKS